MDFEKMNFVLRGFFFVQKNPPPRGGFLFTMFPYQEPCARGPPSKDLYQVLRRGSSYTWFLMREHSKLGTPSRRGGFFRSIRTLGLDSEIGMVHIMRGDVGFFLFCC